MRPDLPNAQPSRLTHCVEDGLSPDYERRLRTSIEGASRTDPTGPFKAQFDQSDSLQDLGRLVHQLEAHHDWERLAEHAYLLFERTYALGDAERLIRALNNTHDSARIIDFFGQQPSFLDQTPWFREAYAWALYREGQLLRAQAELDIFHEQQTTPTSRALTVQLAIASGSWSALLPFVASEYVARHQRSANDLFVAASLAIHVESPHAKDLLFAAASASADDADVLAGAYMLACKLGVEDTDTVTAWLRRAISLSGPDGPVQSVSVQEIVSRQSQWQRLESKTIALLQQSELPLFLAGFQLGQFRGPTHAFPCPAQPIGVRHPPSPRCSVVQRSASPFGSPGHQSS